MKETILLYNLDSAAIRNKIKFLCIQGGIHIRVVEKNQYDVPIGTLAFGKKEDISDYLCICLWVYHVLHAHAV